MVIYIVSIIWVYATRYIFFPYKVLEGRNKKLGIAVMLMPVFFILAFRGISVGVDTPAYYSHFFRAYNYTLFEIMQERMEPGYQILVKSIAIISDGRFQWLLIITAAFIVYSVGRFIYFNSTEPSHTIVFFITLGLFVGIIGLLRQAIAMCICLYAYEYIKNKKLIKFTLVILLAAQFHTSAWFFLPAYFIAWRKLDFKNITINAIGFGAVMYFAEDLLIKIGSFGGYNYDKISSTGNGQIFFAIVLIITVASIIFKKGMLKLDYKNTVMINLNYMSFILWGLRLISRTAERPSFYYMFATIVVFEAFLPAIKNYHIRQITTIVAVLLSIGLFLYRLNYTYTIVPFKLFWD